MARRAHVPTSNSGAAIVKNDRIDEAKITGMTPPVFTFNGMCVLDPPYCRRPDDTFGVLHRDAAMARSTKMIAPITTTAIAMRNRMRSGPICPVCIWSSVRQHGGREVRRQCRRRSAATCRCRCRAR